MVLIAARPDDRALLLARAAPGPLLRRGLLAQAQDRVAVLRRDRDRRGRRVAPGAAWLDLQGRVEGAPGRGALVVVGGLRRGRGRGRGPARGGRLGVGGAAGQEREGERQGGPGHAPVVPAAVTGR
ncbi:MAG: hypothetical protein M9894_12250 [Planctomycetes bacterium]|nr:hypothetical protein [Planctomycetota bacterium]